jgi:hypothetical protein
MKKRIDLKSLYKKSNIIIPFNARLLKKYTSIILFLISIVNFLDGASKPEKLSENHSNNTKYDLVIPLNNNDVNKFIYMLENFKKFIKYDKIVVICPYEIKNFIANNSLIFIDENLLVPKKELKNLFFELGIEKLNRVGWYEQQFLKMAYSRICKNEYYLIWDSDTFPIKPVNMFENNHPIFDMIKEYNSAYFVTLSRLIPNLRFSTMSYISEHMIIKTEYMKNLLNEIESNSNIPGNLFWEKIIFSIDKNQIALSGFSEFETYGSYVDTRFPKIYRHRKWYSKRDASVFFGNIENVNENDLIWLSKDYDAISFENWNKFNKQYLEYVKNEKIQRKVRPKRFFKFFNRIKKNKNI